MSGAVLPGAAPGDLEGGRHCRGGQAGAAGPGGAGTCPFDALVLDAEAKKLGGMGLAHELFIESDQRPPVVLLTARPQDNWLAAWARAEVVVPAPGPVESSGGVARALTARRGTVVPAG
ncbi:hypothetical protein [Actinomyces lilanjuaniae]|uniref:hypothetical protein n=1 Tax=Actinomyces lilanjuaniae TaxID=2321394 RepID=UPI003C12BA6E